LASLSCLTAIIKVDSHAPLFVHCPFQAGAAGFATFPKAIEPNNVPVDKVRGRPEKFAEHYAQAKLFFESQTEVKKAHIRGAFRFELSKLTVPAIRVRVISQLLNVSKNLASGLAQDLGIEWPEDMPRAAKKAAKGEVDVSPSVEPFTDAKAAPTWTW
jgi:catalase